LAYLLLAGLALGPLLLARLPKLGPAPGGIVVSPTAPKLDMRVEITDEDDPHVKPLIATLTGQRPQPSNAPDARAVVTIEPQVQLATPEALDRIAAELEQHPHIAVYPWHKTADRYEAMSTFFVLFDAMTMAPNAAPTGLVARLEGTDSPPRVYRGANVVAERRYPDGLKQLVDGWTRNPAGSHPLLLVGALLFFAAAAGAATRLALSPSWATFGVYAAAVFAISLCIRQVAKFTRLFTLIYPVSLLFFVGVVLRGLFVRR
jgi:hypothetical protein